MIKSIIDLYFLGFLALDVVKALNYDFDDIRNSNLVLNFPPLP